MSASEPTGQRIPRHARPAVTVLLAAIVVCAAFTIEAWPLTAWQLFSHTRDEVDRGWTAVAVYGEGDERPYPLSSLGAGYRHFHHLMPRFESGSPERRAELCAAWLEGTERFLGERAREVRIYRRLRDLADRRGDRSAPPELILRYRCADRPGGRIEVEATDG